MKPATSTRRAGLSQAVLAFVLLLFVAAAASAQTLKVWILVSNADVHRLLDEEWIPQFEAQHPGVTVEWEKD